MNIEDFEFDTELNEDWEPKRDYKDSLLIITPWLLGVMSFTLTCTLVFCLYSIWESSPLFYLLNLIGKIVAAIIGYILSFIVLIISGSAQGFRNTNSIIASDVAGTIFGPLIVGILTYRFVVNICENSKITIKTLIVGACTFLLSHFLLLAVNDKANFLTWTAELFKIIIRIFVTKN